MCIILNLSSKIKRDKMGSTLCSRPQRTVAPVDQQTEFSELEKTRRASQKSTRQQDKVLYPVRSWQREVSLSDSISTSNSNTNNNNNSNLNLNSSFTSRQSVKFFRRRSVRPSTDSLAVARQPSLANTLKIDGQLLRKYTVHNKIGNGAFSTVLLIESKTAIGQKYALKIIEKKRSFRTNVPWERELDILKRVHHPNIIHLYETHSTTSKVYFVLELASGGDLRQRLESCRFNESRARSILKPLLDALCYLHRHGVTHRDLKLENCLFKSPTEDLPILLSDFGLAHLQPKDKKSEGMQTTCGTADYISPEMLEGEIYTQLVDMWSFGIITFAILSRGKMPFQDENKPRLFKKIREANYSYEGEAWNSVSNITKDFINKLLCVRVSQRLTAVLALEHEWMTAL